MKLPVIKHIQRTTSVVEINTTIQVLENIAESPSVKDEERDVIGELISNLCGAVDVHQLILDGVPEKDAGNFFMKKVLSSIDQ